MMLRFPPSSRSGWASWRHFSAMHVNARETDWRRFPQQPTPCVDLTGVQAMPPRHGRRRSVSA